MSKFAPRSKVNLAIAVGVVELLQENNFTLKDEHFEKGREPIRMAGRIATVLLDGWDAHIHIWEDRVVVTACVELGPTKVIGDFSLSLPDCFDQMLNLLREWKPPPCKPIKSRSLWIIFPETPELSSLARRRSMAIRKPSKISFS